MSAIISLFIFLALAIISLKLISAHNIYEKITVFYFASTLLILLILINAITNFDDMLDIVTTLFLLQLVTILFLLFNRKKI